MKFKHFLKGAIIAGAVSFAGAGTALAQAADCEATEFSSKTGELYLKAETELLQNKNAQAALGATGVAQIYEIFSQLRGEAGDRQVKNAKVGLTENGGGMVKGDPAAVSVHILAV